MFAPSFNASHKKGTNMIIIKRNGQYVNARHKSSMITAEIASTIRRFFGVNSGNMVCRGLRLTKLVKVSD